MKIRRVEVHEAALLKQVAEQIFFETFAASNDPLAMKQYMEKAFALETLEEELKNPASQFYFSEEGATVSGYLKVNFAPAQSDVKDAQSLEIERIYVHRGFQGKGIAQTLLQKAIAIAGENELAYLWLGVWEHNPRAIRFYEKNGFKIFSSHEFLLGEERQTDLLMKREI